MPVALAGVDWEEVKALFMAGLEPKDISAKMGMSLQAVRQRVHRGGWLSLRNKAQGMAVMAGVAEYGELPDSALGSASSFTKSKLASHIVKTLEALPDPSSWKAGAKAQQALEPLVRSAKTVFGWSDTTTQPLVRIAILSASGLAPLTQPDTSPAGYVPDGVQAQPVIEVESSKVEVPKPQD